MEQFITWLGIVMSIILFTNKLFFLEGKDIGWNIGALGTILAILYLWLIDFPIMSVSEIGILVLMIYGNYAEKNKIRKSPLFEKVVNIATLIVIILLTYFTFSGLLKLIECVASIILLVGLYALSHKWKPVGWFFLFLGHLLTAYMAYFGNHPQTFFGDFQIASAIVAAVALTKRLFPSKGYR